jgi:cation diffusion facilitator family transporter
MLRQHNRTRLGNIEGWLAITANLLLFVLKFWAGYVTGSLALIADAWHTLSDSFSSVIVLIGIKIAKKPADHDHPFGHGRAELIASLVIGVFMWMIAFNFILKSIEQLKSQEAVQYGRIAIVVIIISILVKEALAQYAFWAGKKTNSNALKADGWHHRTDSLSTIIILIGIFAGKNLWWIDSALSMLVAIMIAWGAFLIVRQAVSPLLGENPSELLVAKLQAIGKQALGFDPDIHHIHFHRYGDHIELTFHITLPSETSLSEAHHDVKKIEQAIEEELNMTATIHTDPSDLPEKD